MIYLDYNGNGKWDGASNGDKYYHFGNPTDKPVAGDWNKDGKTEIGVFRDGKWYLDQNGDGKWNAGDSSFNFGSPGDTPVAGDFDGDGDLDVVASAMTPACLNWYANDGAGGFGPTQNLDSNNTANVRVVALDQDGDRDLLLAEWARLAWSMNDGTAHFGPPLVVSDLVYQSIRVATADIDADGDPDAPCASYFDDRITWYENLGLSTGVSVVTNAPNGLGLYPNPMSGSAMLSLPNTTGAVDLHVVDAMGRTARSERLADVSGHFSFQTADLVPGAYLLRVINGERQWTLRFVKE